MIVEQSATRLDLQHHSPKEVQLPMSEDPLVVLKMMIQAC
jgi:hypothetical protein